MDRTSELIRLGRKRLLQHVDRFSRYGDEETQARELLAHAAGGEPDDDDEIDARTRRRFERLIERRASGEPIPYIRGYEDFLGSRLAVRPGAFVPRQSTEFLARQAVRRLRGRTAPIAADIATGVGAVALVMAREAPNATVYGTDVSETAIRLARSNARANELRNVTFALGSMFDPLPGNLRGSLDVITSHPPYVAGDEVGDMPVEVVAFEPITSLTDDSSDGLGLVRALVDEGRSWLKRDGWLCIEIASELARPLRSLLTGARYRDTRSTRGPVNESRVLVARR